MFSTRITKLLNIEYPLFQGGMAWVADANLAAAVSNAGGLGIIAGMNLDGESLRKEIKKCKDMTKKPFAVNLMLMSPYIEETANVVIEENIKVITTGAGDPSRFMNKWKEADIKVIPVVASVALAKMMEKRGASAVIAEGGESGGHVGDLTTMVLLPQVCDNVDIPVVAAGGIFDGRSALSAFILGATGLQLGTRFLVAKECNISNNYKEKVIKSKDVDTIVTGKRIGHATRMIKNEYAREMQKFEYDQSCSNEELEQMAVGALRKAVLGDIHKGSLLAGQVCAMIKKEQTCKEIIEEIFDEVDKLLERKDKWIK